MQTRAIRAAVDPAATASRARGLRAATVVLLTSVLLLYLGSLLLDRPDGYSLLIDGVLGNAVLALPAGACLLRAVLIPAQRVAFTLIGLAAATFTAGNLTYIFHVQFQSPVPYPSLADIGYLLPYPLLLAAVLTLAWPQLREVSTGTFLDGVLGALSCAAAGSVLTLQPVLAQVHGSIAHLLVGVTYPVADLTLAALIVAMVTLRGGRPGATWVWLGCGVVGFAVADTIYLYRVAVGSYTVGTPLDGLWAVGLTLMAIAAVLPYRPGAFRPVTIDTSSALLLPNLFSLIGVGVLIYGSLSDHPLPVYAVLLTVATLLTAVKRTAVGFQALRQLGTSRREARTDELTQLSNRRHFDELAQRALADRAPGEQLAMLMLDLDEFKAVNDTFGHPAGDELLRQIGPRLQQELRAGDLLARLGGDEFGLLLTGVDRNTAVDVAARLLAKVSLPFLIDGELQSVTASIGVALAPDDAADGEPDGAADGLSLAVLRQRADAALLAAKAGGQGVLVYDPQQHATAPDRLNAREALARHELVLVYQPQFDLKENRMVGVEALVRWQHPTRGLLFPDAFLPFFEQAGLMPELTLRVLELGAAQVRDWRRSGTHLQLSVNLAPSALLRPDLVESIGAILIGYGLAPGALTIEITENAMMLDLDRSRRALTDLRALGIQLSLDDYGTGYCSLTYLRDLPLDEVKIDRSFVMTLLPGSTDATIVASTVELARALGLRTVAEGVETADVLRFLTDLGCDVGQGYLLGRPMSPDQLLELSRAGDVNARP